MSKLPDIKYYAKQNISPTELGNEALSRLIANGQGGFENAHCSYMGCYVGVLLNDPDKSEAEAVAHNQSLGILIENLNDVELSEALGKYESLLELGQTFHDCHYTGHGGIDSARDFNVKYNRRRLIANFGLSEELLDKASELLKKHAYSMS